LLLVAGLRGLERQAAKRGVDDLVDQLVLVDPGEFRLYDQQGGDAVDRRPQDLARGLDVERAESALLDATLDLLA